MNVIDKFVEIIKIRDKKLAAVKLQQFEIAADNHYIYRKLQKEIYKLIKDEVVGEYPLDFLDGYEGFHYYSRMEMVINHYCDTHFNLEFKDITLRKINLSKLGI